MDNFTSRTRWNSHTQLSQPEYIKFSKGYLEFRNNRYTRSISMYHHPKPGVRNSKDALVESESLIVESKSSSLVSEKFKSASKSKPVYSRATRVQVSSCTFLPATSPQRGDEHLRSDCYEIWPKADLETIISWQILIWLLKWFSIIGPRKSAFSKASLHRLHSSALRNSTAVRLLNRYNGLLHLLLLPVRWPVGFG